jgi:hypothetical protein
MTILWRMIGLLIILLIYLLLNPLILIIPSLLLISFDNSIMLGNKKPGHFLMKLIVLTQITNFALKFLTKIISFTILL